MRRKDPYGNHPLTEADFERISPEDEYQAKPKKSEGLPKDTQLHTVDQKNDRPVTQSPAARYLDAFEKVLDAESRLLEIKAVELKFLLACQTGSYMTSIYRQKLMRLGVDCTQPSNSFELLTDLGEYTIPFLYDHETRIELFRKKCKKRINMSVFMPGSDLDWFKDIEFQRPSLRLQPMQRFRVLVYRQVNSGLSSTQERLEFILNQGGALVGVQGGTLMWQYFQDRLPRGYAYLSYDYPEKLHRSPCTREGETVILHHIPYLNMVSPDPKNNYMRYRDCEGYWGIKSAFFCFIPIDLHPAKWNFNFFGSGHRK